MLLQAANDVLRYDVALRAKGKLHFPNTKVLEFWGAFCVFRGKKQTFFNIAPFLAPFGLERVTFVVELFEVLCYNIFERREMQ